MNDRYQLNKIKKQATANEELHRKIYNFYSSKNGQQGLLSFKHVRNALKNLKINVSDKEV